MKGPRLNETQIQALLKKNEGLGKDLDEIVAFIGRQGARLGNENAEELREMILRAFTRTRSGV